MQVYSDSISLKVTLQKIIITKELMPSYGQFCSLRKLIDMEIKFTSWEIISLKITEWSNNTINKIWWMDSFNSMLMLSIQNTKKSSNQLTLHYPKKNSKNNLTLINCRKSIITMKSKKVFKFQSMNIKTKKQTKWK